MNTRFEFWLMDEKNDAFLLLPVTPKMYEITFGQRMEIVNATAIGDIPIAGNSEPITLSLESFFPKVGSDYYFTNRVTFPVNTAMDYVTKIKEWVDNHTVIRLVIADSISSKINRRFYVESIRFNEDNESNGDINYTVTLREYRELSTPVITAPATAADNNERPSENPPKAPKTYTVKSGDYLSKIARELYGNANAWQKIYDANKDIIGGNPNLIFAGQVYTIP